MRTQLIYGLPSSRSRCAWYRLLLASCAIILASRPALQAQDQDEILMGSIFEIFRTSGTVKYEQEAAMGETIALDALAQFGPLIRDDQALQYVTMVGNAVARASSRPHTPYYFAICQNADANAFSAPGGYVFLTTGLLKQIQNEEQLAGVIGHEIAHITEQHAIKTVRAAKVKEAIGQGLLFALTKDKAPEQKQDFAELIGDFSNIIGTGFSRKHETSADKLGLEFAYRAGYQPQGLRGFLSNLAKMQRQHPQFSFYNTHKNPGKRASDLDKEIKAKRYVSLPVNPRLGPRFTQFISSKSWYRR